MVPCKNCQQTNTIKNGLVRGKQRYKCHACHYLYVVGDERHKPETEVKKALSVILYSLGKASFGFLAKLFGVSRTTTYYWIRDLAATIEEPVIAGDIQEIDFDEMWHFITGSSVSYVGWGIWRRAWRLPWPPGLIRCATPR